MFWNGLSAAKEKNALNPRDKLRWQILTYSFLLLLESETETPASLKTSEYMQDAITVFESSFKVLTIEEASYLLEEIKTMVKRTNAESETCEEGEKIQHLPISRYYALSEIILLSVKAICKVGYHNLARCFLTDMERMTVNRVGFPTTPLVLCKRGIMIHSTKKADEECHEALKHCARILRSVSTELDFREGHTVLEVCNLLVWAVENGHSKELSGAELLALFSFLEEYQERTLRMLDKVSVAS